MKLERKEKCTGCMACVQACSRNCIKMEKDILGHLQPVIDMDNCIKCGKCQNICPSLNPCEYNKIRSAYGVWSLDSQDRKSSASGGAASVFYRKALKLGFSICGVEYQDKFRAVHILTNDEEKIENFKQSKYVYSEIGQVYKEIKGKLKSGEKVLFISLPCKVAGLLKFLGEKQENLITVDIVCHGTPSLSILQEHIDYIDKKNLASQLKFRQDNEFMFWLKDSAGNLIYKKIGRMDTYLAAFLEGIDYRQSCYTCDYARAERVSDITICDFWGLGAETPFEHPYSGAISAVLINTEKGGSFFEECRDSLFAEERMPEEAIKGNAQLNAPTAKNAKCIEFEKVYTEKGFESAVKNCLRIEIKQATMQIRKRQLRCLLRKIVGLFFEKYRG